MMLGPRYLGPYPDRVLDCQEAVEPAFMALLNSAEGAGWVREEVIAALAELAINHVMAFSANEVTDAQIADLQR
ncbi:hypothetical protein F8A10_04240 [Paracoccus kondratievae]|uniref:hypothetical protein n=1 Tax=Paracoccus TaxID=265 RepID=UPI000225F649|nr:MULTISPECIES: hypothetical protein [Paracoccus]QFQ86705.1 hypothetical protein F8A10_04240 [Paracoccus kondratievae]